MRTMAKCGIEELDLQALVDGGLNGCEETRLLGALETSAAARRRYEALTRQKKLLQLWWVANAQEH